MAFYDEIRWKETSNYNLINFYRKGLDNDTKLLTHWICYITDRQMDFKRIWDVGGFVFSELVDQYKKTGKLNLLNPNVEESFIKKNGDNDKKKKDGYHFVSKSKVGNNEILKKDYLLNADDIVEFTPRYYPADYFSILLTFYSLEEYGRSLTKFIATQIEKHREKEDMIKRVLFSLYLLTYYGIGKIRKEGQIKRKDIDNFFKNIEKAKERNETISSILNNDEDFEKEFKKFKKDAIFKQKRAWCSLRDFFKSPEFSKYFKESLEKENVDTRDLFTINSFRQFELPGDVWNNNSKFRMCILENTEYENSKKSLNKILREYYDKNKEDLDDCYPEQFDVTFDFVPRMCAQDNCEICPIGFMKGKGSNFQKTCVKNKNYYCTVSLINCNYKIRCLGNNCKLVNDILPNLKNTYSKEK